MSRARETQNIHAKGIHPALTQTRFAGPASMRCKASLDASVNSNQGRAARGNGVQ